MQTFLMKGNRSEGRLYHKSNHKSHYGKQNIFIDIIIRKHNFIEYIFRSNSTYAPYLPAEKETTTPTENFVHLLDAKYSLEPLILAFKPSLSNDQPNLLAKKIRVSILDIEKEACKMHC